MRSMTFPADSSGSLHRPPVAVYFSLDFFFEVPELTRFRGGVLLAIDREIRFSRDAGSPVSAAGTAAGPIGAAVSCSVMASRCRQINTAIAQIPTTALKV